MAKSFIAILPQNQRSIPRLRKQRLHVLGGGRLVMFMNQYPGIMLDMLLVSLKVKEVVIL
ncbi:hypothetical protein SynROS8604_01691 [Synechococcus sp. ROS8604]|nr:hypothetical protein SynROS8604_01691 [Synechococcus sp. ROS8604]